MKKLYLVFLMVLILFIPGTHAVAVYQLDQPIKELDNYTLREVFENRNIAIPDLTGKTEISAGVYRLYNANGITIDYNTINGQYKINGTWTGATGGIVIITYSTQLIGYTTSINVNILSGVPTNEVTYRPSGLIEYQLSNFQGQVLSTVYIRNDDYIRMVNGAIFNDFTYTVQIEKGETVTPYQVPTNGPYSDIDVSQFNLTSEQIQTYYNLYLEAIRFENENIEASKDDGGYQNIFKSIINGVKGLMESMGDLWQFLNAPIITSDMQDYSFSIDWSWDLIGVVRQLISNFARLILQTNFIFINVLLSFTGIPIQVSLLTLLFSNFVFVILGWIIVKSFII